MDSRIVNRGIRKTIWPVLKEAGFDHFTSRAAWRHRANGIDVIEFQSFNRYNADVLGVTTFSFCVNLGKFLLYVPPRWEPKVKGGVQLPSEPECVFRGRLLPQVSAACSNEAVWSVDEVGKNVRWCLQDVLNQLPKAFAWYSGLDDREEVFRILMERDENMRELWGFGRNPSPMRSYHAGYVALALGRLAIARSKLQEAVDSKSYVNLFSNVDEALGRTA